MKDMLHKGVLLRPLWVLSRVPLSRLSMTLALLAGTQCLQAMPIEFMNQTVKFNIPAQRVETAILVLSKQAHIQVLVSQGSSLGGDSPAIVGKISVGAALDLLLQNTGLRYIKVGNAISITDVDNVAEAYYVGEHVQGRTVHVANDKGTTQPVSESSPDLPDERKSAVGSSESVPDAQGKRQESMQEVLVTAQKREERLQDVPESISVLSSDEIARRGITDMDDYLRSVPGVSRLPTGAGRANPLVIRGLSLDPEGDKASVGIYFGEVPLTNSLYVGDHFGSPDLALVDMAQIEVLKGPQGTLYGSGSLAGVVRNQPAEPNLQEFQGGVTTGLSSTALSGGANYQADGVVNFPIINDELAVRVVGYHFDDSGDIENVAASSQPGVLSLVGSARTLYGASLVNQDDQGHAVRNGARLAVLWRPDDNFNAEYTYIRQRINQEGDSAVNLGLGNYEQALVPTQPYTPRTLGSDSTIAINNLVLDYDLQWAKVLSSTSDTLVQSRFGRDETSLGFGPLSEFDIETFREFAQEVRMTSSLHGPFQYLVGAFYENTRQHGDATDWWVGQLSTYPYAIGADYLPKFADTLSPSSKVTQKSEFGEFSLDLLGFLKATVGVRHFSYNSEAIQTDFTVPAFGLPGFIYPPISSDESGQVYKAGLSAKATQDILVYATWSQGFRLGSPAAPINPLCGDFVLPNGDTVVPGAVKSDRTNNYEIGTKSTFINGQAHIDTSVFRIDWADVPITILNAGATCGVTVNAGNARSQGVELQAGMRVTPQIDLEIGGSFTDAKLTESIPSLDAANGARLPGSPRFTAQGSANYDFLAFGRDGYFRTDLLYVGTFYNNLQQTGEEAGGYFTGNLGAGMHFASTLFEIYVDNVTESEKLTWIASTGNTTGRAFRLRPRTVGARLNWKF